MSAPDFLPSPRRDRARRQASGPAPTVRALSGGDFFAWYSVLDESFTAARRQLADDHALQLWQWLQADPVQLEGLLVEIDGTAHGFVLFRHIVRPVDGTSELVVDQLYTDEQGTRSGAGDLLLIRLHEEARRRGASRLRSLVTADDEQQQLFWSRVGQREDLVTFELEVNPDGIG